MQFARWISAHGTTIIPQNSPVLRSHVEHHVRKAPRTSRSATTSCLSSWPGCRCCSAGLLGGRCRARGVLGTGARRARHLRVRRPGGQAGGARAGRYVRRASDRCHHPHAVREPQYLERVRSRCSSWSAGCRCGSTASAPTGARKTPDRGGPAGDRHARSSSHVLAGVAGLLLGLIFLVRLDGSGRHHVRRHVLCILLVLRRQRQVVPTIAGLIVGTLYGSLDAAFLTAPYLFPGNTSVG